MSEPADIFVSYAREDEERAGRLVRALEACGWRVFWDRTIPPGETWRSHIGVPLDQAAVVLVIWSRHSIDADFVHSEANRAKARGALVPVLVDEVAPPLGFEHIHAADLVRWITAPPADLPDILVRTLQRRLSQPVRPIRQAAPATPPVPRDPPRVDGTPGRRVRLPVVAGAIAALVVAAGLGALAGGRSDPAGTTAELTSLRDQNRRIQDQLRGEAKARQDADDLAKAATTKAAAVEKEMLEARAAKGDAEERLKAATAKAATLEKSLRDSQTGKGDTEERIKAANARIAALEKELRDAQAARSRAEDLSKAAAEKSAALETQSRDGARQLDAARQQLQSAESELRKAASRADAAEKSLAALKREIDALKPATPAPAAPTPAAPARPTPTSEPATSSQCYTRYGTCTTPRPMALGSICDCQYPSGPLAGVIVR